MMSPFETLEFVGSNAEVMLVIVQPDHERTRLEFQVGIETPSLDWFQIRDMYCALNDWLVNNAHLAKEN